MEALQLLADAPTGMTVLQLATTLKVEKSVASRLLATLMSDGYLVRDADTERYQLSLKLMSIAFRQADRLGFPRRCQPILLRLSDQIRELVQLSAVDRDQLLLVANSQPQRRLTVLPNLGSNVVSHATASGKVWLASLPDEEATKIALRRGLSRLTDRTITKLDALLDELARVRTTGYAVAEGEFEEGVNAIAYAVGAKRFGKVVGTIAISAPAARADRKHLAEIAPILEAAAADLEAVWPMDVARVSDGQSIGAP